MADTPTSEQYAKDALHQHKTFAFYAGPQFEIPAALYPHVENLIRCAYSAGRLYGLADAQALIRGTTPPKPATKPAPDRDEKYPDRYERVHDYTRDYATGIPLRGEI